MNEAREYYHDQWAQRRRQRQDRMAQALCDCFTRTAQAYTECIPMITNAKCNELKARGIVSDFGYIDPNTGECISRRK